MNGYGSYTTANPCFTPLSKGGDGYSTYPGLYINTGVPKNGEGIRVFTQNEKDRSETYYSFGYDKNDDQLGDWLHMAIVVDGKDKTMYLDGVEVARDEQNLDVNFTYANSQDMFIGIMGAASPEWYPFNGKIDDIRIYNMALTPSEINVLFKGDR